MVGSRGIPEDTSHLSSILYYLTAHSPRTVVERVDFRSGAGYGPERDRYLGPHGAPTRLITPLGVFDWGGPDHAFRAVSLHPGVTPQGVQEATGFPVDIPADVPTTEPPDAERLAIIRAADPLEVRKLELLGGRQAAERLVAIYERERQAMRAQAWSRKAWPRG
jgi:glutaconate CoA-transferase subunit B